MAKKKKEVTVPPMADELSFDHPLLHPFHSWCKKNGVSLEHKDDWLAWWECYLAGAIAENKRVMERIREENP